MPIPILPDAPSRTDPTNFSAKADAWVQALGPWTTAANQLEQSLQLVATTGTSTTSKTIANGSWTLTTQTGKAWSIGAYLYFTSSSDVSKVMTGQVTAYNSGTGSLTVNITVVRGSGTYADWVIGLAVPDQAALNLSGGSGGSIPYQSSTNTTSMLAAGTAGQYLLCNGSSAPSWGISSGRLLNIQVFNSPGTYTYTASAGTTLQLFKITGAGGGGGGVASTSAGQISYGGAGGGGGYIELFTWVNYTGCTLVVGSPGSGGTGGGAGGNVGGSSSVVKGASTYLAAGGGAGFSGITSSFPNTPGQLDYGGAGGSIAISSPGVGDKYMVEKGTDSGGLILHSLSLAGIGPAGASPQHAATTRYKYGSTSGVFIVSTDATNSSAGSGGNGIIAMPSIASSLGGFAGYAGRIEVWEYS